MLLRTVYQPDETLHSFIFRVCMINGVEQYADLTDNKGHWRFNLKLSRQIRKYFMSYSDRDILTLGQNSGLIRKNTNIFGNPLEYMSVIKKLYSINGDYNNIFDNLPVNFCIDCIRDSLRVNGYGFFKAAWMQKWTIFCDTHKKPLTFCAARPARNSHEIIKQILRGEYPQGSFSKLYRSEILKETPPLNYVKINDVNSSEYKKAEYIHLAFCLKNEIENFINYTSKRSLHVFFLLDYYRERGKWRPYRNIYNVNEYEVAVMVKALFDERNRLFLDFWHKNAKTITLYGGIFEYTEASETFYIYQGTDKCGACCSLNCPVKARKRELVDNLLS